MNDRQKAQEILDALGGKENIAAASHCATRLRLVLNDEGIVHQKKLEDMDIVKGHSLQVVNIKLS